MRTVVLAAAICLSTVGFSIAADANAAMIPLETHIAPQAMGPALREFAERRDIQVLYFSREVRGMRTNGASGKLTANETLDRLLSGSGLTYRYVDADVVTIMRVGNGMETSSRDNSADDPSVASENAKEGKTPSSKSFLLAQADTATSSRPSVARSVDGNGSSGAVQEHASNMATLKPVIVTAQILKQDLQNVPVAVTAVSSHLFEALGGKSIGSLAMAVPDLQINPQGGVIAIRGIGTTNTTDVGDPDVAFEIDGFYQPRAQTVASTLYDVQRIEVLRGPQGTLYGQNATTGVVNVITKKPTWHFESNGYVETGNYGQFTTFGAINVPVSHSVAVRAAFISRNHNAIYNNGFPGGQNYGDQHENAGRVHVLIKPRSDLSVLLTGSYSDRTGAGDPGVISYVQVPLSSHPYSFPITQPGSINLLQWKASGVIKWKLSFGTLEYDAGYHESRLTQFRGANGEPGSTPVTQTLSPLESRAEQYQLRLAGSHGRWQYVAGIYYFLEHQNWEVYVPPAIAFLMPFEEDDSRAGYLNLTYAVTHKWHLIGGVRYTKDHKTRIGGDYHYTAQGNVASTPFIADFGESNVSKVTYKIGSSYNVARHIMVYANYSTGFKNGGFFDGVPPNNSYKPEFVRAIEGGVKSRFFNNRLQLDVAAFHYHYEDFQISFLPAGSFITQTFNAQLANNSGAEFEVRAAPDDNDRVSASLTYLYSRFDNFSLPTPDSFGRTSYAGKTLPFAPQWAFNLDWQHSWRLPSGNRIEFMALTHFQSGEYLDFHNFANTYQPAYTRTDLNLSWVSPRFSVRLFVRNLENNAVLLGASPSSTTNPNAPAEGTLALPRMYGVRLSFNY